MKIGMLLTVTCLLLAQEISSQSAKKAERPAQTASQSSSGVTVDMNGVGGWGRPPKSRLLAAIREGDVPKVKRLLRRKPNLNRTFDRSCLTPLVQAVISREPEMPKLLLDHGALPNYAPKGCEKPLGVAASEGNLPAAQALIARGAIVDEPGANDGGTPLLRAAATAKGVSVLQELVKAGADVHAVDNDGDNALMSAAGNHNLEAVRFLLGIGMDPCAHNKKGKTGLDFVEFNFNESDERKNLIQFFQKACSKK
jgi:ankyrin repeat protein